MNEVDKGGSAGLPLLLWLLTGLAVTLLCLATVSIAAAAPHADPPAAVPQPPMILPDTAGISGATTPENSGPDQPGASGEGTTGEGGSGYRHWIIGATPDAGSEGIATRFKADRNDFRSGIYRVRAAFANDFARQLERAGRLIYAEPDTATTAAGYPWDRLMSEQWWLNRIVSTNDTTPPPVTRTSPLIGIIEQALDPLHPDLVKANLTGAHSIDAKTDTHGTSVAGIIGSPGKDGGIRGVWPGARMRHFPSGGSCLTSADAVKKAARRRVFVVNMSYTLPAGHCYTHYLATEFAVKKGVLPVASAGNSGPIGRPMVYPAADPHVLSVSATQWKDDLDLIAEFATRNRRVDLTAPGAGILAPVTKPGIPGPDENPLGTLRVWAEVNGTSFSAPMVTAAAAWVKQDRPRLTARQVGRLLTTSATDLGVPGRDPEYGEGLLNIENALAARAPRDDPMEPNDDISLIDGSTIGKARFLWKPRGPRVAKLRATLSRNKDPIDVYRVRMRGRQKIQVTAAQIEGDVRLFALKPSTKTVKRIRKKVIVRSDRPYPKTEGIRVHNLRRKAKNIWIMVRVSPRQSGEYSDYRLTVRALKKKKKKQKKRQKSRKNRKQGKRK